jgi:hypothetical protein
LHQVYICWEVMSCLVILVILSFKEETNSMTSLRLKVRTVGLEWWGHKKKLNRWWHNNTWILDTSAYNSSRGKVEKDTKEWSYNF